MVWVVCSAKNNNLSILFGAICGTALINGNLTGQTILHTSSYFPKAPHHMHNYLIFGFVALTFACQSRSSEQAKTETSDSEPAQTSTSATPDTLCFRQIMSRDTTTLSLTINGDQVSGYLDNKPYEKDRAQGPFQGTVSGSTIQADWQRSGEGTTQPYTLDLTLKGDSISWLEGERLEKQGKWILKDPKAGYNYVLTKIDCSTPPLH